MQCQQWDVHRLSADVWSDLCWNVWWNFTYFTFSPSRMSVPRRKLPESVKKPLWSSFDTIYNEGLLQLWIMAKMFLRFVQNYAYTSVIVLSTVAATRAANFQMLRAFPLVLDLPAETSCFFAHISSTATWSRRQVSNFLLRRTRTERSLLAMFQGFS